MNSNVANTVRAHLDRELEARRELLTLPEPPRSWIQAIRRALGMTERQLAERIGVSQSTVHRLEQSERNGTISLNSLQRAAEQLDCTVVYALIPRRSLQQTVEARARELARRESAAVERTMALESQDVVTPDSHVEDRAREILSRGNLWRTR